MQTLSTLITVIDKDDEEIYYYDELSFITMQVAKDLKLFGNVIVNVTDLYGTDEFKLAQMNKIIDLYGDGCLIISTVQVSNLELHNIGVEDGICTEEAVKSIQEALIRDANIMKEADMVELPMGALSINCTIPFIYPNDLGKLVIEHFETSLNKIIQKNEVEE